MANIARIPLAAALAALTLVGAACDPQTSAAAQNGCTVTIDYKIHCPDGGAPPPAGVLKTS